MSDRERQGERERRQEGCFKRPEKSSGFGTAVH